MNKRQIIGFLIVIVAVIIHLIWGPILKDAFPPPKGDLSCPKPTANVNDN